MYIQVKRGKPTMYQSGDREFVCLGQGVKVQGVTMRGAYTMWKNQLALQELNSDEADRHKKAANSHRIMMGGMV